MRVAFEEWQQAYLHGSCWALAVVMHRATGWPLRALVSSAGLPLHGCVERPDGQLVDAAGVVTLPGLRRRYRLRSVTLRPVDEAYVDAIYGLDAGELAEARRFWRRLQRRVPDVVTGDGHHGL